MMHSTWRHVPGVSPCAEPLGSTSATPLLQEKGFAKSCSLPCRYHHVTYALDSQHLALLHAARCPGGAGETSCPPVACLTGAEETGRALTLLLPPSPSCSHSPTSPHEEGVNITSLCQGHQPGPRCPSTHGPTKQSTLTLPGRTASEEHLRGKWPPPEQRGSFSRSRGAPSPAPGTQLKAEGPRFCSCASEKQATGRREQEPTSAEGPVPQEWG